MPGPVFSSTHRNFFRFSYNMANEIDPPIAVSYNVTVGTYIRRGAACAQPFIVLTDMFMCFCEEEFE